MGIWVWVWVVVRVFYGGGYRYGVCSLVFNIFFVFVGLSVRLVFLGRLRCFKEVVLWVEI